MASYDVTRARPSAAAKPTAQPVEKSDPPDAPANESPAPAAGTMTPKSGGPTRAEKKAQAEKGQLAADDPQRARFKAAQDAALQQQAARRAAAQPTAVVGAAVDGALDKVGSWIKKGSATAQAWVDRQVDQVANAMDDTGKAVDQVVREKLGDGVTSKAVHLMVKQEELSTHFTAGVVKGASGLVTGAVGLVGTGAKLEGKVLHAEIDPTYGVSQAVDAGKAIAHAARHPVETARGAEQKVKDVAHGLRTAVGDAWKNRKDTTAFVGEVAGQVTVQVASVVVPGAMVAKAGSAAALTEEAVQVANTVEKAATVTTEVTRAAEASAEAAEVARTASDAGKAAEAGAAAAAGAKAIAGVEPEVARSVQQMFEAGPNRWVEMANPPAEGKLFTRGLSGNFSGGGNGVDEAMTLLRGQADNTERFVSEASDVAEATKNATQTNSLYARPLTVRGRVPAEGSLRSLPPGARLGSVEAIGTFAPPSGEGTFAWAKDYLRLAENFTQDGMTIDPASRGGKFIAGLKDALATAKYGADDGFGRPMLNASEVESAVQRVIAAYR